MRSLAELDIPKCILPEPKPLKLAFTVRQTCLYLGGPIPIAGAAGDQQSALFDRPALLLVRQRIHTEQAAFTLMNTGEKPISRRMALSQTIVMGIRRQSQLRLEGSIFVAGLRDSVAPEMNWRITDPHRILSTWQKKVKDTNGCYSCTGIHRSWEPAIGDQ